MAMAFRRLCRYARSPRPRPSLPLAAIECPRPAPGLSPPLSRLSFLLPRIESLASSSLYSPLEGSCAGARVRCLTTQAWADVSAEGVVEVPLAQTGEGIAECELLKWFVKEGDEVEEFQPLCEVQSDKATIEITSRYKGKILQIHFPSGDIVKVGETLLRISTKDAQTPLTSESHEVATSLNPELCESVSQRSSSTEEAFKGVLATPSIRHLAKEYCLDINDIKGTGKDGRVLKEDVLNYAAGKVFQEGRSSHSQVNIGEDGLFGKPFYSDTLDEKLYEDKTIPLRGFQRSMVKSMTMSAKVPHFHYLEEINCDALIELKAAFQNENRDPNVKYTFLPFFIKSLSMALSKYPLLNSSFNEEATEVILKGCHNIGIAMATPYGLVVPNIKKVQSLSILEITKELSRLHLMASNNKLSSEDITGGTITISNIGAIGGKFGSPLLNLPEVAIIAIGRIEKLPRFDDDGTIYPSSITNVTIGADHRVVDGATVARFCNEWKLLVEKPELLLLHMR